MTAYRLLPLTLVAILALEGCKLKDQVKGFFQGEDHYAAAVTIGGTTYSRDELEHFFDSRLSEFRDPENVDKLKSNLLESFVDEKLLLLQAEKKKVLPGKEVIKAMMDRVSSPDSRGQQMDPARKAELERDVTDSLKMQQYLNEFLLSDVSVSDEDCEAYYKAHLGEYVKNDVVRVREILVDDLALADKILGMLKKSRGNRNFPDLAQVYSKGATAVDGGELGVFQRGDLPEDFEKAIFNLSPGSVSRIVRTAYGFHIFLVEEKIPAHQQKLIEVKAQIKEELRVRREREIINSELESLRKEVPVVIHRELLGFHYIGTRF